MQKHSKTADLLKVLGGKITSNVRPLAFAARGLTFEVIFPPNTFNRSAVLLCFCMVSIVYEVSIVYRDFADSPNDIRATASWSTSSRALASRAFQPWPTACW